MIAQKCPYLEQLWLHVNMHLTALDFKSVQFPTLSLNDLNLMNTSITDECIENITSACPNLKKMNISQCLELTDQAIIAISLNCKALTKLDISIAISINCRYTADALTALGSRCLMLESLNMCGCLRVTKDCVKTFVEKCIYLCCLEYTGSVDREIPDENLEELDSLKEELEEELEDLILEFRSSCDVEVSSYIDRESKTRNAVHVIQMTRAYP